MRHINNLRNQIELTLEKIISAGALLEKYINQKKYI